MPPTERSAHGEARPERPFGLGVGTVMTLLGVWWLWRGAAVAYPLLFLGISLLLLAIVRPRALAIPRYLLLSLLKPIGEILTWTALALVYYLVLTPIAIAKKLTGWDPLMRRGAARTPNAWQPYPSAQRGPDHFKSMF